MLAQGTIHSHHPARRILLLALFVVHAAAAERPDPDLANVQQEVATLRRTLGERAGEPETPDIFQPIPSHGNCLTIDEANRAWGPSLAKLQRMAWWKRGLDPTQLTHALREPAAVVEFAASAQRANAPVRQDALVMGRKAADFLIWTQEQAGTGVIPFPAARSRAGGQPFAAAERYLARAERDGTLGQFTHNGWITDDDTDGGLQFDNGEAGVALFDLYVATGDEHYLTSARRAADWALARPIVRNWNYNSFSVYLLARAYAVTHEPVYLTAAQRKAVVGMLPGQLKDGPHAGRWLDPHNARPAYHYIMLRALAELAAVLPRTEPVRSSVLSALELGLRTRNAEILGPGVTTKDKAMETLLIARRALAADSEVLARSLTLPALDALGILVSEQYRAGKDPLGPREWGLFLEYVAERGKPAEPGAAAGAATLDRLSNPVWESEDNLRDPSVLPVPGGYQIYYSRLRGANWSVPSSWTVARAFTKDFRTFQDITDISPQGYASPGDVIGWHGRYLLPYQSYPATPTRLCVSESKDLTAWTRPRVILAEAAELPWNTHHRVIDPSFVIDGDVLHCFFVGSGDATGTSGKKIRANLLGHAVTRDPDLQRWEILTPTAPLIGVSPDAPDGVENVMVFRTGAVWTMIYSEGLADQHLALATSNDLRAWQREGRIEIPRQKWMARKFGAPFVWKEGNEWRMILMGENDRRRTSFGLLISSDGRHWTPLPER